jgi:hypothetical protein
LLGDWLPADDPSGRKPTACGGFTIIAQVRAAVEAGQITLDRNQYIGLLCYEDILEELSSLEVETFFPDCRSNLQVLLFCGRDDHHGKLSKGQTYLQGR